MKQKVIVVRGKNDVEAMENDIAVRLDALVGGWRIVSVSTALVPWGEFTDNCSMRHALHVYMVTTIVVEWP